MALIICPKCGGTVSDKASVCVRCGYPLHGGRAVQVTRTDSDTQSQHFCTACGAALPHGARFARRAEHQSEPQVLPPYPSPCNLPKCLPNR